MSAKNINIELYENKGKIALGYGEPDDPDHFLFINILPAYSPRMTVQGDTEAIDLTSGLESGVINMKQLYPQDGGPIGEKTVTVTISLNGKNINWTGIVQFQDK